MTPHSSPMAVTAAAVRADPQLPLPRWQRRRQRQDDADEQERTHG
jgi:hypothetical protein